MALLAEMRRRNVFKVALLYAVLSWLVVWFVGAIQSEVDLPVWTETFMYFVLVIGFPLALWFAWTYEITPVGLKKAVDVDQTQSIVYKTGQKLNAAVAVLTVLGVLAVFGQRLLPTFEFLVPGPPQGKAPASPHAPPAIRSHTLGNGLEVVVWPDEKLAYVGMQTIVRVGSRDESSRTAGLSHLMSYMLEAGLAADEAVSYGQLLSSAGATHTSLAGADVVTFTNRFPPEALRRVFEIEGLRFDDPDLSLETLDKLKSGILNMRELGVEKAAPVRLEELVRAVAFVAHPYHRSVTGWPSEIQSWSIKGIQDFYEAYFAPSNRTIVLVGNVSPQDVFALARDHLGGGGAAPLPTVIATVEPRQLGERRIVVQTDEGLAGLLVAFHAGSASDPDFLTLQVLLHILAAGGEGRLNDRLAEEESLATYVEASLVPTLGPGLVNFYVQPAEDADVALLEQRLLDELQRVAVDGVTDEEIAVAGADMLANYHSALVRADSRVRLLGRFEAVNGNFERLFDFPEELSAITAADLQRVARAVFDVHNMTVGILQPRGD